MGWQHVVPVPDDVTEPDVREALAARAWLREAGLEQLVGSDVMFGEPTASTGDGERDVCIGLPDRNVWLRLPEPKHPDVAVVPADLLDRVTAVVEDVAAGRLGLEVIAAAQQTMTEMAKLPTARDDDPAPAEQLVDLIGSTEPGGLLINAAGVVAYRKYRDVKDRPWLLLPGPRGGGSWGEVSDEFMRHGSVPTTWQPARVLPAELVDKLPQLLDMLGDDTNSGALADDAFYVRDSLREALGGDR